MYSFEILFALSVSFTGLLLKFYGLLIFLGCILVFLYFVYQEPYSTASKLKKATLKPYNRWYYYVVVALITNLGLQPVVSSILKSGVKGYKIPSGNMEPSLMVGDYFYAGCEKYFKRNKPKRGDIIVFQYPKDPSKDFIERVIGLGGEKLEIVKNKIYINDQRINDPWGHYKNEITMGGVNSHHLRVTLDQWSFQKTPFFYWEITAIIATIAASGAL